MKLNYLLPVFLLVLLFSFISCEQPAQDGAEEVDVEAVRAEIADMEAAFAEAANANDAEALVKYYADDAVSMPPEKPSRRGKDAILAAVKEEMAKDTSNIKLNLAVQDVWAAGDLAVEVGTYTGVDANGNTVYKGKYMTLFEKQDTTYKAIRDIWNSDMDDDDDEMEEEKEM